MLVRSHLNRAPKQKTQTCRGLTRGADAADAIVLAATSLNI